MFSSSGSSGFTAKWFQGSGHNTHPPIESHNIKKIKSFFYHHTNKLNPKTKCFHDLTILKNFIHFWLAKKKGMDLLTHRSPVRRRKEWIC